MTSRAQSRTLLGTLFCLLCLGAADISVAQVNPVVRIGYVDMKRLIDNAPQVTAGRHKLEREFASRDVSLKDDEKKLSDLRDRRTAQPDTDDATGLQREIDTLDRSIKRQREQLRAELKTRSDQELDASWRAINDAVVEFARDEGFDLIIPSPVVYASAKVDVTEKVLERLRRKARAAAP